MKQQEEDEEFLRRQSARDAVAIVTRERITEEVRERAQQPRVVPQEEYDRMLEMKKKQIEHMAKVLNQTNKEMAILQEQNKDLEEIVSKGLFFYWLYLWKLLLDASNISFFCGYIQLVCLFPLRRRNEEES